MAVSTAWSSGRSAWIGDQAVRLLDPHPGDALALLQLEPQPHGGLGLGGGAGELGVALAGVDVAQVEASPLVEDRQEDPVAGRHVADVEVAAPLALAVDAGGHLAVGRDAERADERRDRPRALLVEVQASRRGSCRWGRACGGRSWWCTRSTARASASTRPAARAAGRSRSRNSRRPRSPRSRRPEHRRARPPRPRSARRSDWPAAAPGRTPAGAPGSPCPARSGCSRCSRRTSRPRTARPARPARAARSRQSKANLRARSRGMRCMVLIRRCQDGEIEPVGSLMYGFDSGSPATGTREGLETPGGSSVWARLSGMIEVVCGLRSAISSALTAISRPCGVGEDERALGRLLEQDAGEDGPVGPGHAPGDELGGDLLARREDRLDQPAAVDAGRQGREVRARPGRLGRRPGGSDSSPAPWNGRRPARPADGSAGPSSGPSQASRSAAGGRAATGRRGRAPADARLSTNSSDAASPRLDARRRRVLLFRERDSPQARGALRAARRAARPSPAPGAGRAGWSHHRPGPRSPRHGAAPDAFRSVGQLAPGPRIAPASGLWHRLRTASIRTASSVPVEEPPQAIERQGGVVGPEHPQAALEHRRRAFEDRSRGRRCSPRRPVRPWDCAVLPSSRSRAASVASNSFRVAAVEASPASNCGRNCLQPMLADPLDRREVDRAGRGRPGIPAAAHGLPGRSESRRIKSRPSRRPGARSFEPASAISSPISSERRNP